MKTFERKQARFIHSRTFTCPCLGLLLASAFLFPPSAAGQASFAAQLRGTVKDSSGAVVPGAAVTITNEATGVAAKVASDNAGRYTFNNLQPANYTVAVEATGFNKLVESGITLRVSQQSVLDLKLQVGTTATSVDVQSNGVLLNSANGELGQEISGRYTIRAANTAFRRWFRAAA